VILAAGSPVAEQAKTSNAAAILRGPNAENVSLTDVASSKPKDAALIDAAPQAGIADPREYGFESVPTIAERLAAGADLVVIDGSGLLGGPACGLILGKHEQIDAVTHHPLNSLLAADPLTIAALTAVLKIARNETGSVAAIFQLPIWQLLTAPQANLEQRARRLAAQLVGASGIATADAREVESAWRRWGNRTWSAKSWCIELRPADGDCDSLAAKLAEGPYPILARIADGAVQLDLRSVFPHWDQQLVTAAEGARGPTVTSPSSGSAAQ
jgi:L-seryl-tRNA(Ser) seleniumtransferase